MTRHEQIKAIVNHLTIIGRIASISDMARQIDVNVSTLISANNGNEKYLTKNLLCYKIGATYPEIFNPDWLRTGEGEMLKQPTNSQVIGSINNGIGVQAQGNARVSLPNASFGNSGDANELIKEVNRLTAENIKLKAQIEMLHEQIDKWFKIK